MTALLVVASLAPLAIAALTDVREARYRASQAITDLLSARADELVGRLDGFNHGFERSVGRLAALPTIIEARTRPTADVDARVRATFQVWVASDPAIRGVALLDRNGIVKLATEPSLIDVDLSKRPFVGEALEAATAISDVYVSPPEVGDIPTVAYAASVLDSSSKTAGIVVIFVRASAVWDIMFASNELAGKGSFAVMFDHDGVRIGHTQRHEVVFHPGGQLDAPTIDALVAERRFGDDTRRLVSDTKPFPEQFDRARSLTPDRGVFRGFAANQTWNLGVARRLATVSWTVFYMLPEATLEASLAALTRTKELFAVAIIVVALIIGLLFAAVILTPIRALSIATHALAGGDRSARVKQLRGDEVGALGASFNAMADEIGSQATALETARNDLEARVIERTAELAESEDRLSTTLLSIGDAVIATDAKGTVTRMNPVAEKLTGWPVAEAIGRALTDVFKIVNEDTRATVESPVDRVLREGVVVGLANHTALIARDGSECAIADSGAPIRDARGALHGVVLVFRDQTVEREAERALRTSEARFRRLTESGIMGIVLSNTTGTLYEANDAFLKIVGYTREDLQAGRIHGSTLNAPEWAESQAIAREQLKGHGMAQPWEKEFIRKDGSRVPVLIGVLTLDQTNTLSIVLDLTEKKRSEAAIRDLTKQRESDAKFRALLEAAPDAMVIVDGDGRVVLINAQTERLFGYSRDDLVGKAVDLLVPRAVDFNQPTTRILGSSLDLFGRRQDGSEFPIEISLSPLDTKDGVLVSSAIRDVTARVRAEEELRRAKDVAETARYELEAFSYSVAHDLRAPLRGMNGFAQVLVDAYGDKLDADGQDALQEILLNARRMGALIDALLSLSRVTQSELRPEFVDLSAIVRVVVAQLSAAEPERTVDLVVQDGLSANLDSILARTLIENLLSNAWKFTSKVPVTCIEFGVTEKDHAFYVRDNGAGFDMAFAKKLFEPFQRLHTVAEFPGTGIGLATVQRIVHRHGGRLWADGTVDGGATFHFSFSRDLGDM